MAIIYHEVIITQPSKGIINKPEDFESACREKSLDPKNVVFIFPGNESHHTSNCTLFSIKKGGGLAKVATFLGEKGYPTLSLPTTGMDAWDKNPNIKKIVYGAIADLYKAVGAGFHLMLPVRPHTDNEFFEEPLKLQPGNQDQFEPCLWGGIAGTPNLSLSAYYTQQLNLLHEFIHLDENSRTQWAEENLDQVFQSAYTNGIEMLDSNDAWLQRTKKTSSRRPNKSFQTNSSATSATSHNSQSEGSKQAVYPSSYHSLFASGHGDFRSGAKALLNDYTKNNSWVRLIFTGHWNRHHVKDIAALVKEMGDNEISLSNQELMDSLNKIRRREGFNKQGSLAKRIMFIEEKFNNLNVKTTQENTSHVQPK